MFILDCAKKRYSTKSFKNNIPISNDKLNAMKELLRLSPSSVNLQPWHCIFATTKEGKAKISKSTDGMYAFNKEKITNASAVVVFCMRSEIDSNYLIKLSQQELIDGRFESEEAMEKQHSVRSMFVNMHKDNLHDFSSWVAKQIYLNIGVFLLGVSAMGLDSVPIEGFDSKVLDQEFDLKIKKLSSLAIVAVGYHADDDYNANLPKSRLQLHDVITEI